VISLQLREPLSPQSGLKLLPGFLRTLSADAGALRALLRNRNIQVVNAHFPTLDVILVLLLKKLGLYRGKFLLTFHGADITEIRQCTGSLARLWRGVILSADAVVACSDALRRDVLEFAPRARVITIHNGADIGLFDAVSGTPRSSDIRRLLHIGKFEHKKSQDIILRAFKQLLNTHPDCSLVLIGADGPMLLQTRKLVEELGLQEKVELHVNVPHDHLPAFMETADLFLLPSRAEPFGIVLLEAGAAALPVIATRVGGIPELLEHERTGILIAPGSVDELLGAMLRLMDHPSLARQLALNWHERVMKTWNWDVSCEKYLQMIEQLS
jgi:glycosyltransferase involved in cell wall biosynthesis